MRPIHTTKRLYSIAASPPLKSTVRSTPTSPRPRRASLSLASVVSSPSSSSSQPGASNVVAGSSGSRSLYTNASGPLHYFDSAVVPPAPPPSTSRPSSSNVSSSPRLSLGEAQSQNAYHNAPGNGTNGTNSAQSPHSQQTANSQMSQQSSHGQGQQGQTSGSQQSGTNTQMMGSSSLMLSVGGQTPPPGSSPPDYSLLLNGPRSGLASGPAWRLHDSSGDAAERSEKEEANAAVFSARANQKMFQLEVGAYGIPKRGRECARSRTCVCPSCLEEQEVFSMDFLNSAVQVGEDAYFVRDDALGVADGVGGWASRQCSGRPSSAIHSCNVCSAATSSKLGNHGQGHRHHLHRPRSVQPSPSALFARRLMHFCAHEVEEAHAAACKDSESVRLAVAEREPVSVATMGTKPSLKNAGIGPRVGRRRTVEREFGNARPFAWPWDNEYRSSNDLAVLEEEELSDKNVPPLAASATTSTPVHDEATKATSTPDPLEGTIDPVDVLERAYNKTIDAHRVRRRVRIVKERKATQAQATASRWFSYGLGLGSGSSPYESLAAERDKSEEREWEWQELWEPLNVGSSTALLAVLSGDRLRVAHLGDCAGWLVRAGEIVWRSEEMWWGFNYPVQLGPSSPTRPTDARRYEINVQADDILILASDGVSDNCWEEDVLDEVRRAVEVHMPLAQAQECSSDSSRMSVAGNTADFLGRKTLAGMLSEALCSRAKQLSMQSHHGVARRMNGSEKERKCSNANANANEATEEGREVEELPFERRAREEGKPFRGGKADDISVLVAIISPVPDAPVQVVAASAASDGATTSGSEEETATEKDTDTDAELSVPNRPSSVPMNA